MKFKVEIGGPPIKWVYDAFDSGDIIPLPGIKGELGWMRDGCAVRVSGGWDYAAIGDEIVKEGDSFRVEKNVHRRASEAFGVTLDLSKIDYSQITEVLPA